MRGLQLGIRRYIPRPVERYEVWGECYSGFGSPSGPLNVEDVTETARRRLSAMVTAHMRWHRKPRFLGKWTGWSRISFIRAIFPEARFIHVVRDGRFVARSLLAASCWDGWDGPENWSWGPLPPHLQPVWDNSGRSFLVLAALQWKLLVREIANAAQELTRDQYLQVRFEEMATYPGDIFARILDFCGLAASKSLDRALSSARIISTNEKRKLELTDEELRLLSHVLESDLRRLGYQP